jgi:hypothetical protein
LSTNAKSAQARLVRQDPLKLLSLAKTKQPPSSLSQLGGAISLYITFSLGGMANWHSDAVIGDKSIESSIALPNFYFFILFIDIM